MTKRFIDISQFIKNEYVEFTQIDSLTGKEVKVKSNLINMRY